MSERVSVIGAGVIGLTCAVTLAEAGYDTQVFARDLALESSSAAAAGLWLPPLQGASADTLRLADLTLRELTDAAADPDSGVTIAAGTVLHRAETTLRPSWAGRFGDSVTAEEISRPKPGYGCGWTLRLPTVELTAYLRWLERRLAAAGGSVTRMSLPALPPRGIVVNASGAAARWLASDEAVRPVRGQVVVLSNPGITSWWLDGDPAAEPLFVIPAGDTVVVGGTCEPDEWDRTPTTARTEAILRRVLRVEPRLADADVLGQRVGLAPERPSVRVELVDGSRQVAQRTLVHCYGHGSHGLTLSWGSAHDTLGLVQGIQQSLF